MTIIDQKYLKCAVCGHIFQGQILLSTYSTGSPDLDLRPSHSGLQTLGLEISTCPNCHYVSHDIEKAVSEETKAFVLSHPAFNKEPWYYTRALNYQNLMCIALFEGRNHDAFTASLKAAWAKEAAGSIRDPLGSFKIRCEALELFEKYENELLFDEDIKLCLKADLLRRTARFEEVVALIQSANPTNEQTQCILRFHEHLAKERNSKRYSIDFAMKWYEENKKKKNTGEKISMNITQNLEFWKLLDELVNNSEIVIDRPKETAHPKFPNFIYKVDYGYLKDTASMDGDGIDVWVGSKEEKSVDAVICIVDMMKRDSEIKILIGCTDEETALVYETHNETDSMKGILIQR